MKIVYPIQSLQEHRLELPQQTTATGAEIQSVSLLKSIEPTEIGDARALGLDFIGDAEDRSDWGEGGGDNLVVEDLREERRRGRAPQRPSHQSLRAGF